METEKTGVTCSNRSFGHYEATQSSRLLFLGTRLMGKLRLNQNKLRDAKILCTDSSRHSCCLARLCSALPLWILNLLRDKVERIPARVGEQGRVEGQGDGPWFCGGALEWALEAL